jgi:chemotaxis protein CheD
MGDPISVGLGESVVSKKDGDVLVAYGLGSCVAVSMYDPHEKVCGLLHAVLPEDSNGSDTKTKYVDTGIEELLKSMEKAGAHRNHLIVRIAGGANMITAPGFSKSFDIGTRNIQAAHKTLEKLMLPLKSESVGGNMGRTVRFFVDSGQLTVRMIGGEETNL